MRFWRRKTEDHLDRLLRESRPAPREELISTIVSQIAGSRFSVRRSVPLRRVALATFVTALAVSVAALMGGIHSAAAGAGGLVHVATKTVSSSHTSNSQGNKGKGDENDSQAEQSSKDGDDEDEGDDEGEADHHQYKVTICHWANHKYVTITVSPQGAANHKAHHPLDIVPAPPGGCP